MTRSDLNSDWQREGLVRAIMNEIKSWPEIHRLIFVRSHYQGDTPAGISGSLGLSEKEVRAILQNCDSKLRAGLKAFREPAFGSSPRGQFSSALFAANGLSW